MNRTRLLLSCVVLCSLVGPSKHARADVSAQVYDDVKGIIEDLITDEIAQSIVPSIACYAYRTEAPKGDPDKDRTVVKIGTTVYRLDALFFFPQSLQHVYSAQFGALKTSLRDEASDMAGYKLYQVLASPDPSKLSNTFQQFRGQTVLHDDGDKKLLAQYDKNDVQVPCVDMVRTRFNDGAFTALQPSALDSVCSSPVGGKQTFDCDLALALRATLQGKPTFAEDYLIQGVAAFVTDVVMQQLGNTNEQTRTEIDELVVLGLRDLLGQKGASDQFIKDLKSRLASVAGIDKSKIEAAVNAIQAAIERIRVQWQVVRVGGTQNVDVATFASALTAAHGGLDELCKLKVADGLCKTEAFSALSNLLREGQELWPAIRAAAHGDLAEAARATVHTLFATGNETTCSKTKFGLSGTCKKSAFQTFVEALVEYVYETIDEKGPSDATRAAFRSAAVTAIRTMDEGGGYNRRGWHYACVKDKWYCDIPVPGASWVLPDLGLRVSWSPGYVNDSGRNLRYVASASMVTSRITLRYTDQTYAALHLSFIDPLSPLSELAIRDGTKTQYNHSSLLVWNVITPRLELVYGVPFLSKKLVLSAGASLRLVSPFPDTPDKTSYSYGYLWDNGKNFDQWSHFVEFGLAVKYIL